MRNTPLHLTYFSSLTDTKPKPHDAKCWEHLVEALSVSRELLAKENGDLWSPARYRPATTRRNENVESVSCLVLDFDDVKRTQWEPFLEPYEYFAHTTHRHTPEQERWRVVLPLPSPVAGEAWTEFWLHANDALGTLSDDACKDPARFYFHPAHKPGCEFHAFHHVGIPFHLADQPPRDAFTQHTDDLSKKREKQRLNSVSRVLSTWDAEKRQGRHNSALRSVLALERLRENGASVDDALARIHREFVSMILDRCSPAKAEKEWNDIVESAKVEIASTPSTQRHSVHNTTTTRDTTPEPKSESENTTPTPTDDDEKRRESIAEKLVRLGLAVYDFTLGDDGQPLAVPREGSPIARPVRGDHAFQDELSATYFQDTGKPANPTALNTAVSTFAGFAQQAPRRAVYYRSADLGDRFILDLGEQNGAVVEITANGHRVLDVSPVVFRRSATLGQLPRPTTHDLDRLRELVPADEQSFRMIIAWLVASHFDIPRPILFPEADQGAGKTTLVKLLKRLTDPSPVEVNPPPRDEKHWRTVATNSHVVVLDNVSRIEHWLSDALCRAVTGDGAIERTLYSDNAPSVYAFRRAVVLTSIHLASLRGDLTERLLPVTLRRIPDNERRPERELDEHFQRHVGEILAGIYRLTAGVLATLPNVTLDRPPRMADFAKVLLALDDVTGWDTFSTYRNTARNIVAHVAEADEVGRFLLDFAPRTGATIHTTQQLLDELRTATRGDVGHDFPRNAQQLGTRLSYLVEPLRKAGVVLDRPSRSAKERRWTLSRVSDDCDGCDDLSLSLSVPTKGEITEAERKSA